MIEEPYNNELVFRFEPIEGKPSITRKVVKRSKRGCFNCRKRKKKCDEIKPSCTSCSSKCIECIWAKDPNEKLPRDYKVPEADVKLLKSKPKFRSFVKVEFAATESKYNTKITYQHTNGTLQTLDSKNQSGYEELKTWKINDHFLTETITTVLIDPSDCDLESTPDPEDCLDTEIISLSSRDSRTSKEIDLRHELLSTTPVLSDHDYKYISICANGFLISVGPQYTHPKLTTSATFIPFLNYNDIMIQVSDACGCAFMAWDNPNLKLDALSKYNSTTNALRSYMRCKNKKTDELWLGAAFQMMCLCSKLTWSCTMTDCVESLTYSYSIIKRNILRKYEVRTTKVQGAQAATDITLKDEYLEEIGDDNLRMEIENSMISFEPQSASSKYKFQEQFERMFIESFVYNYSIAILLIEDIKTLPTPFDVFSDLRKILKTPLFNCDVPWMNNPIFGAAFDAYEIVAKASYLLKRLSDPMTLSIAKKLYDFTCFYPSPVIPVELRSDPVKFQTLKDSILVAEITLEASKIILKKVIDVELREADSSIQKGVSSIIHKLQQIRKFSQTKGIIPWALFVCGLACIDSNHRTVIVNQCLEVGQMTHGRYMYTVLQTLNNSWDESKNCSKGLDILLDNSILSGVIF